MPKGRLKVAASVRIHIEKRKYWTDWCRGWESNPHDLAVNGF